MSQALSIPRDAVNARRAASRTGHVRVSDPFTAVVHTDLARIAEMWRSFQRDGVCTAYQRFEWSEGVATHLASKSGATPLIVEIRDVSGAPVMLLPLVLVRRMGHTAVQWLDLGVCDYAAPIMAPGWICTPAEAAQIWTTAKAALPRADLIHVTRIPGEMAGMDNPLRHAAGLRRIDLKTSGDAIDGDAETLMNRLASSSTRKDLAKGRRRLAERGEVAFVEARTEAEVDAIFVALLEQRRQRFREIGRFDLLASPEFVTFYRDAARRGLDDGAVRLFGISVGGEWVATAYGLVHHGAFHGILLAMAGDAWKTCSPGLQIAGLIMTWARREGLTYFDFTIGALSYKAGLGAKERDLYEISEARTLRGHAILRSRVWASDAKAWLRAHPRLFEKLRTVRQTLRRATARGSRPVG